MKNMHYLRLYPGACEKVYTRIVLAKTLFPFNCGKYSLYSYFFARVVFAHPVYTCTSLQRETSNYCGLKCYVEWVISTLSDLQLEPFLLGFDKLLAVASTAGIQLAAAA